ncbi:hypothetical protein IV203_021056 [Nitzschia inconspicua]|uniref:Uncharacterized protein n=1 Tax=Nitzschia inconspicua TaxID=303405 RepID=A0A9K3KH70_9STRA|nr:hypothetical protein IV203_021056 [Nitzschia inconspicua]
MHPRYKDKIAPEVAVQLYQVSVRDPNACRAKAAERMKMAIGGTLTMKVARKSLSFALCYRKVDMMNIVTKTTNPLNDPSEMMMHLQKADSMLFESYVRALELHLVANKNDVDSSPCLAEPHSFGCDRFFG